MPFYKMCAAYIFQFVLELKYFKSFLSFSLVYMVLKITVASFSISEHLFSQRIFIVLEIKNHDLI